MIKLPRESTVQTSYKVADSPKNDSELFFEKKITDADFSNEQVTFTEPDSKRDLSNIKTEPGHKSSGTLKQNHTQNLRIKVK